MAGRNGARSFGGAWLGSCPPRAIPIEPSLELLYEARRHVLDYLDWYSNDAGPVTPAEELRRDFNHAAARLIEICLAIKDAESRKSD